MKNYDVYENGCQFGTVEARSIDSAIKKIVKEYPRRAADYNLDSGETCHVDWLVAQREDESDRALLSVSVPGVGMRGVVDREST